MALCNYAAAAALANVYQVISLLNSSKSTTSPSASCLSPLLSVYLSVANLLLQSPVMACVNFNCVLPLRRRRRFHCHFVSV